jgi:hypothetical protein
MVDNINKKPITIYWSSTNCIEKNKQDWSFLYPNPKTLFLDLKQNKEKNIENSSFFSCPAINDKTKKILVFYSPMSCEYEYDFNNDKNFFSAKSENYLAIEAIRKPALKFSPTIQFSLGYCFFSEEPLDAYFTPPMFHKPEYLKYGSCFPGEFDIGQWFRPYNFEVQPWEKSGNFILKENEPLFYVELKTKRDIIMKKFNLTEELDSYIQSSVNTTNIFGRGQTLLKRYERFKNVGMKEKIITAIKKNIIEDSDFVF